MKQWVKLMQFVETDVNLKKITVHNSSTVNKHNELRSDKQDVRC